MDICVATKREQTVVFPSGNENGENQYLFVQEVGRTVECAVVSLCISL